ncbi:hypothetical protein ACFL5U_03280 [Candidatus Margulisiibacteriota bacterium]
MIPRIARTTHNQYLGWVKQLNLHHQVPAEVAAKLAGLQKSTDFVEVFPMPGNVRVEPDAKTTTGAPRISFTLSHETDPDCSAQLLIPTAKAACDAAPAGSFLVNFLLPPDKAEQDAKKILKRFKAMAKSVFEVLESRPFACLTGTKSKPFRKPTAHDLDHRGFRLFSSPAPDALFTRIGKILEATNAILALTQNLETTDADFARAEEKMLQLKAGNPLLEDAKQYRPVTTFVDLRV